MAHTRRSRPTTGQAVLFGWPEVEYLLRHCRGRSLDDGGTTERPFAPPAKRSSRTNDVKANLAAMKHSRRPRSRAVRPHGHLRPRSPTPMRRSTSPTPSPSTPRRARATTSPSSTTSRTAPAATTPAPPASSTSELTSGLFYGYVVVDVPAPRLQPGGLQAPRSGWRPAPTAALAANVVEHLCHLIAKVSPGAKLGSTAPFAWAGLMLIEAGSRQPRSLANAFRKPVRLARRRRGRGPRRAWPASSASSMPPTVRARRAASPASRRRRFRRPNACPWTASPAWAAEVVRAGRA